MLGTEVLVFEVLGSESFKISFWCLLVLYVNWSVKCLKFASK